MIMWLTGATGTSGALFNNVFRVMRVASVDTLQIQLPEVPKAAPGGTIRALVCDVGIKVEGARGMATTKPTRKRP